MPAVTAVFLVSSTVLMGIPLMANMMGASPADLKDITEPIAQQAAKAAVGLMEDERMRNWCAIGSFCGSWMSVLAFRPRTWQEGLAKWLVSFISALIFIPFAIEAMGMAHNTSAVLAISGFAALIGWTLVQRLTPILEALAEAKIVVWARTFLGMPVAAKQRPKKPRR